MAKEEADSLGFGGQKNESLFSAYPGDGKVTLKWTTSGLEYFDRFVIERSMDGQHFVAIIIILGKAFLNEEKNHSSFDLYPLSGKSYYRLKFIYPDGEEKLFYTEVLVS